MAVVVIYDLTILYLSTLPIPMMFSTNCSTQEQRIKESDTGSMKMILTRSSIKLAMFGKWGQVDCMELALMVRSTAQIQNVLRLKIHPIIAGVLAFPTLLTASNLQLMGMSLKF